MKLHYFAQARGYAEAVRLFLVELGKEWDEVVVEGEEGVKNLREQGLLPGIGHLPVLEISDGDDVGGGGDLALNETRSILEDLAVRADAAASSADSSSGFRGAPGNKYAGASDHNRSQARSLASALSELHKELLSFAVLPDGDDKTLASDRFKKSTMPEWFDRLERLRSDLLDFPGFIHGCEHFTFADLYLFDVVNQIVGQFNIMVLVPYPNLKEFHDACVMRKNINVYVRRRPFDLKF
jgi:glutathione S-transferase